MNLFTKLPTFSAGDYVYANADVWDEKSHGKSGATPQDWQVPADEVPVQGGFEVVKMNDTTLRIGDTDSLTSGFHGPVLSDSDAPSSNATLTWMVHWYVKPPSGSWAEVRAVTLGPFTSGTEVTDYLSSASFAPGDYVYVYADIYDGIKYGSGWTSDQNYDAPMKWAVIVGISDYKAISDLNYCDEDATDVYNYLTNVMGYTNIRVLGDTHTGNYPAYYATATEANVTASLNWMVSGADTEDEIAFITSGHGGSGDGGGGSSYLCMWDCNSGEAGEDGNLYDTEFAAIISPATAGEIFILVDHCYSGGLIPEIQALSNSANVYMTTTCTEDGYGWDDGAHFNGAWTYYFLEYGLINHFGSNPATYMEDCFTYALANYPYSGGDTPQQFDGNAAVGFTL